MLFELEVPTICGNGRATIYITTNSNISEMDIGT
jgi:hypothetical protein